MLKRYNVPIVQTIHSPPPIDEKFWLDNAKNFVDLNIVLSNAMKKWLKSVGYPDNRIIKIPGFIDFELFNPNIKINFEKFNMIGLDINKNNDNYIIFCPARFSPSKGVDVLLKAFRLLNIQDSSNVKLLLTGRFAGREFLLPHSQYHISKYIDYIKHLVKKYNLQKVIINYKTVFSDKVNFIQRIPYDIMPYLYKISDVLTYPSLLKPHFEAFGLALIEAMRMEIPIVATRNGGMREILIRWHYRFTSKSRRSCSFSE